MADTSSENWKGEFFSTKDLKGSSVSLGGTVDKLDFNWGKSAPLSGIPSDGFSARFEKKFSIKTGVQLSFKAYADDGVRVYIDDHLVIDSWKNASYDLKGDATLFLESGSHTITVEYYDNGGSAALKLIEPVFKETNTQVHYNWGKNNPKAGISEDYFYGVFDQSQTLDNKEYFAQTFSDDRVRLTVNDVVKINRWSNAREMNRAILGTLSGETKIETEYYENSGDAALFSDIAPLGDWIAYYYNNTNLSLSPVNAEIIEASSDGNLVQDFGYNSPMKNINTDYFSARFVTAKRIPAGDYIIRARADDGIRVLVDGEVVVDRFTPSSYREDAARVRIEDKDNSNIHWIEVQYLEQTGNSKLAISFEPYSIPNGSWIGEFYPNTNMQGNAKVVGGSNALQKLNQLNYNWGTKAPVASIPTDRFSAVFKKKFTIESDAELNFQAFADDGVKVYLDDTVIIDSWKNGSYAKKGDITRLVKAGTHTLRVEYFDNTGSAALKIVEPVLMESEKSIHYNWGNKAPAEHLTADRFYGLFNQSQSFNEGEYFVQTFSDDRVRVSVDGARIIDKWTDSRSIDRALLGTLSGNHSVTTEYYENAGDAALFSDIARLGDWVAYYFNNKELKGNPINAKTIIANSNGNLVQNIGQASPMSNVNKDFFSASYTTAKRIEAGEYKITASADDGVRVLIDGELIIDRFSPSSYREDTAKVNLENINGSDIHWIEVQYFDNTGDSKLKLDIEEYSTPKNVWTGELFSNKELKGIPVLVEGTSELNYDWGSASPHVSIPANEFSASFKKVFSTSSGSYRHFEVLSDDGVRVYLDDELIIDSWKNGSYTSKGSTKRYLEAGQHTLRVEYFDNEGDAALRLNEYPVFNETKESIRYNWGKSNPQTGFPVDHFHALFDQSRDFDGQEYFLQTFADDGIRVNVDGQLRINRWSNNRGVNRAILGPLSGNHSVTTEYYENTGDAAVYSDIVPFGKWLTYFYNNTDLSGNPVNAKIVTENPDGTLTQNYENSPIEKVNADQFSASYVTAKRLEAGDYIIRTTADEDIKVILDGTVVADYSSDFGNQENTVKVSINNLDGSNIHWLEVQSKNTTGESHLNFGFEKFEVPNDSWVGEIFANNSLQGTPLYIGGNNSPDKINELNFDWGSNSPHPSLPGDDFSARYQKKYQIQHTGVYKINTFADDGVRVFIDDELVIDAWYPGAYEQSSYVQLDKGEHIVTVEYFEKAGNASLDFSIGLTNFDYFEKAESISHNWKQGSPLPSISSDNFTALFDQSRNFQDKEYFLQTHSNDGIQVKVDGDKKIDRLTSSENGQMDRAIIGRLSGKHKVETQFVENTGDASIFSNLAPFGDWIAYYYNNTNLSGAPENSKVIDSSIINGSIDEDYGTNSPMEGINSNNFSARYVTAKRITAGDYILRARADDGVRVLVDGEVVIDRFTPSSYREDNIRLQIEDNSDGSNIHWIEVQYYDNTGNSKLHFDLEPYALTQDSWIGEWFNNTNLEGLSILVGGTNSLTPIPELNNNWVEDSPHPSLPSDYISGRFQKLVNATVDGYYNLDVDADDGVRVYIDGDLVINDWVAKDDERNATVELKKGLHTITVEYFESYGTAKLMVNFYKSPQNVYQYTNYNITFEDALNRQVSSYPRSNYQPMYVYKDALKQVNGRWVVDGGNWHVRSGPSQEYSIVGYLHENITKENIVIYSTHDDWYRINTWMIATREDTSYYMNPNSFSKDSVYYYQFLDLSKSTNISARDINDKVLRNGLTGFGQTFIDSGKQYGINELYLISHANLETGYGTSALATGILVSEVAGKAVEPKVVYNMYGIGANDNCANSCGSEYAYNQGWFSKEAAIVGGAKFIADRYVNNGKNTLYKMKWNPANPGTNQYATDIGWAVKQTQSIKNLYESFDSYTLIFDIPVYK
ncbi:PA14 domain-containing protein [Radiobacillus sp. PE A8.2]|uniref:PA14 domain-containing protein n=1 Tax=Radiobacillus sp. PE A8.2 TaxID=3380349 RepID=UPI003890591C